MARRRKFKHKVRVSWDLHDPVHRKVVVYKEMHALSSLEIAANILLEKATADIVLPESK